MNAKEKHTKPTFTENAYSFGIFLIMMMFVFMLIVAIIHDCSDKENIQSKNIKQ